MKKSKNITTFEEHLERRYGKIGTKRRNRFELGSKTFMIGELLKGERRRARMTQEQLARKVRTKKSYISRIENGVSDIQMTTLFKIIEKGLGKKLTLTIK